MCQQVRSTEIFTKLFSPLREYWQSLFSIIRSLSSDPDLINILPGFPIKNSPLKLKFYVRLKAGRDQHVTIDSDVTVSIFQAFARNLSDAFGVEFTGMCVKLLLFWMYLSLLSLVGCNLTNIKAIIMASHDDRTKHNDTIKHPSRYTAPTEEKCSWLRSSFWNLLKKN